MIPTAIIAFREFLEAFLIIGVFLGASHKLQLHKEKEIGTASLIGILLSIGLTLIVYLYGERLRGVFTETNADLLEGYLLVFSGLFIVYVIFSLHSLMSSKRDEFIKKAHSKLENELFDLSLFFTIVFLVLREGFEVALFTASASLFSTFSQNVAGLMIGFVLSMLVGAATYFVYEAFPVEKIFKFTEYLIIIVGAALIQHGITILADFHLHLDLSHVGYLGWKFMPGEDTFSGHLLQGLIGVDRDFSVARLLIMIFYIGFIYLKFMKRRNEKHPAKA